MKRVLVMPGHSYKDPGAINEKLGVTEYQYCLERVLELLRRDTWDDIDIVLKTRNLSYRSLSDEVNTLNPDYIIELHLNAANGVAQGTETLYCSVSSRGKKMAEIIQKNFIKRIGLKNRGIKPKAKGERGGHILWTTKAPCVIVEPFFLDSTTELYQEDVMEALRVSIREIVDKGV